mmetsp:Transcript_51927/g.131258  ORF Transcript_51927/g.131258 Transcript_51927/m.131258 type:complete len:233 (+) Transcript_51927:360-1058(+)
MSLEWSPAARQSRQSRLNSVGFGSKRSPPGHVKPVARSLFTSRSCSEASGETSVGTGGGDGTSAGAKASSVSSCHEPMWSQRAWTTPWEEGVSTSTCEPVQASRKIVSPLLIGPSLPFLWMTSLCLSPLTSHFASANVPSIVRRLPIQPVRKMASPDRSSPKPFSLSSSSLSHEPEWFHRACTSPVGITVTLRPVLVAVRNTTHGARNGAAAAAAAVPAGVPWRSLSGNHRW